ncbi:MAG: penicillin-binding protein 1A [Thermodesulfobacteriota bacterium]
MKKTIKKTLIILILLVILSAAGGVGIGAFFALTADLPQIRGLQDYKPSAVTKIFSSDSVLLAELFQEKRNPVPLSQIPRNLKSAIIATEDRNFYQHTGIDVKGIVRALIKDIFAGEFVEGASTITQQLAKTLFLTPQKTIARKIKEAILAFQIERRFTKDEIMELYLNQVYFGSGAYGVESAARVYFGKTLQELNLSQSALIAGMPKAPSRYSPFVNRELGKKRRNTVLKQMLETGFISQKEYTRALNEPVIPEGARPHTLSAPYFVDNIKKILEKEIGETLLYKGGLVVKTTLSYQTQIHAESALLKGLQGLQERMIHNKVKNPDPQGALVSLDVRSGSILAMVGGKDFIISPFNRAVSAKRQPGSAFKPFVYACAIENGFSQNHLILDAPVSYQGQKDGEDWRPENYSREYLGEITLRKALALSQNIPTIKLTEMVGPSSVIRLAYQLGIESPLSPNLSLALGTSEVTLLELTSAFAVFANAGEWIQPYSITEVLDSDGKVIWEASPLKKSAMSKAGAAIITNMLQAVIEDGTGKRAKILGRTVAGKTGTTNDFKDAWFIGYSPSIIAGVWVGQDSAVPLGKDETGSRAALPIWIDFMDSVLTQAPEEAFPIPEEVSEVFVNPETGRPVSGDYPGAVKVLFKKDAKPSSDL